MTTTARSGPALRLARRYRTIFSYTGLIWILVGGILLTPLLVLPAFPAEVNLWWAFALPAVAVAGLGAAAWRLRPRGEEELGAEGAGRASITVSEGAAVVVLAWLGAIVAATAIFLLVLDLTVTQAVFEATSGWTTTGLSVVDVTTAPKTILLLRSILELGGGAGLAILMISVMRGPTGPGLSAAEGRSEQLVPHIVQSTKIVVGIYLAYNALGFLGLWAAGMDWFDALNHAFCAISTGGFSTRPESIGYWKSPLVEGVTMVLMLLGTTSFLTAYRVGKGDLREAFRSGELRLLLVLLAGSSALLFGFVALPLYGPVEALRVAVFNTISAVSTTGYATVDYAPWGGLGFLVMTVLMLIGGGTGSTAGGIKLARIYLLLRVVIWEVRRVLLPRSGVNRAYLWQGGERVVIRDEETRRVGAFLFLYVAALVGGAGVMTASGATLPDALFEMASTLSTVGLSVGVTRPDASEAVLWTQVVGMLLGRLEFFAVIVGVHRLVSDGALGLSLSRSPALSVAEKSDTPPPATGVSPSP